MTLEHVQRLVKVHVSVHLSRSDIAALKAVATAYGQVDIVSKLGHVEDNIMLSVLLSKHDVKVYLNLCRKAIKDKSVTAIYYSRLHTLQAKFDSYFRLMCENGLTKFEPKFSAMNAVAKAAEYGETSTALNEDIFRQSLKRCIETAKEEMTDEQVLAVLKRFI